MDKIISYQIKTHDNHSLRLEKLELFSATLGWQVKNMEEESKINLIDDDPGKSGWSNSIGTLIRSSHIPGPSNIKVTKRVLYVRTGKKGL